MNKVILSVFVLLCAFQVIDGQLGLLGSIIGSVVTTFTGLITLAFNVALTTVTNFATFTIATKEIVAQSALTALANASSALYSAALRNNNTFFRLPNATANFSLQIQNCSAEASLASSFLGNYGVSAFKDISSDLSYSLMASAVTIVGKRYSLPPPTLPYFGSTFFASSIYLCLPDAYNNSAATIGCQARTFNYTANLHIDLLNRTLSRYQSILENLNANCSAFNASAFESLAQQWSTLNAAVSVYVNVSSTGSLFSFNASLTNNFTAAINQSQALIESIGNLTNCVIAAVCNKTNVSVFGSLSWSNLTAFSLNYADSWRRASYATSMGGVLDFTNNSRSLIGQFNSAVANVSSSFSNYANLKIQNYRTAATNFVTALNSFVAKVNSTASSINAALNVSVNATEFIKSAIIRNATVVVNATFSDALAAFLSQNETYPQCQYVLDAAANIFANFSLDLQGCGVAADNAHDAQFRNISSLVGNFTNNLNSWLNATGQCYATNCPTGTTAQYSWLNAGVNCIQDASFYKAIFGFFGITTGWTISTTGQNFVNCYGAVTANATSTVNSIDSNTAAALANLQSAINNITTTFLNCTQTKTNFALDALNQLNNNFTACIQQTTTTTATP